MYAKPLILCALLIPLIGFVRAELAITEFSANSDESFLDEDGDASDWIEIRNTSTVPLPTAGYALTDNDNDLAKWPLPDTSIPAGDFLVVFASGKDRSDPAGELHASFSLSDAGEFLALVEPDGMMLATEFDFPKQFHGISYGNGGYFATPTPGAANGAVDFTDFVRDTTFSVDRGLFDAAFDVEITSATADAAIHYTTDWTLPLPSNGTLYTGPIPVTTTTVLRAVATKPGHVPTNIDTQTYIFPADVIHQPAAPPGFPATWGIDNSSSQGATNQPRPGDYEMDPEVIAQFGEAAVIDALRNHPTISLVMEPDDLWNESTDSAIGGIYPNPYGGTGDQFRPGSGTPAEWERPGSAEFIGFEKVAGKQVNCGVRIGGNFARHPNRYKHHLRLTFRRKYGPAKLRSPLFSRTDVDTFDNLILRGGNSESWTFPASAGNGVGTRANVQYLRDQYYKDSQAAMGHLSANQEYFHLYLNGLYWGFYTLIERVDANFMAEHLGGSDEEYDVMKQNNFLSDGTRDAWEEMFALSRSGLGGAANYGTIQQYLDLGNLIDYILFNYQSGTVDWGNNWRAGRLRAPGAGYQFFVWDGERALGDQGGNSVVNYDATTRNTNYHATELHHDLRANEEYRIRFADHVQRHLFNDGVLTAENCIARYNARADEIRPSLIGESARWGDRSRPDEPYTIENEWRDELEWLTTVFFPQRNDVVISQLKEDGLFPDTTAPTFNQHGGQVTPGFPLVIINDAGDIYYTTDGSDPRLEGGAINPNAVQISGSVTETAVIASGDAWKYDETGNDLMTAWRDPQFNDAAWSEGPSPLGFGSVDDTTFATFLLFLAPQQITAYFRNTFQISNLETVLDITLEGNIDDGAVYYINGVELARDLMPDGEILYNTRADPGTNEGVYDPFPVSRELLVEGTNHIAVEVHNRSPNSGDFGFDLRLKVTRPSSPPIALASPTTVRARSLDNGEWSPLTEATFTTGVPASAENLVISEIHYNPTGPAEDGEFIELLNISGESISLAGVRFETGIQYAFAPTAILAPGARLVLTPADYDGQLANGGETLGLLSSEGANIRSFRYDDKAPWPESPDGDGFTLVLANPTANPDHSLPENWLPSRTQGGTPGTTDTTAFQPGTDALAFFLGGSPVEVALVDSQPEIRVRRNLAAEGADIVIETSDDLRTWSNGQASFAGSTDPINSIATMIWTLPHGSGAAYARVRLLLANP